VSAESEPGELSFLDCARQRAVQVRPHDLRYASIDWAAIGKLIGDTPIVALAERVHSAAEPLEFRNALIEFLVRRKGFTAIALESGVCESRALYDHALGGGNDVEAALAEGFSWGFGELPQNRRLLTWLRAHNETQEPARKVRLYGFDLSGSPGSGDAERGVDTSLRAALTYLAAVDPGLAARFEARLAPYVSRIRFGPRRLEDRKGYEALSAQERDRLSAAINDLICALEIREAPYCEHSSGEHYDWGLRAALDARRVDAWLRHVPEGWAAAEAHDTIPAMTLDFVTRAREVRDRAQADNIEWIHTRQGPGTRLFIFGSVYHLSASPVREVLPGGKEYVHQVAGTYLKPRHGKGLLIIGNLAGGGEVGSFGARQRLDPARPESADGLFAKIGSPGFLVDLRGLPQLAAECLAAPRRLANTSEIFLSVGSAFDAVLYFDVLTPAMTALEAGPSHA
jgi:erythromycin esterase